MKLINFKVNEDNISIDIKDINLDLHNNFDFQNIKYDVKNRSICLYWTKTKGAWLSEEVSNKLPNNIMLEFLEVSLFKFEERDSKKPFTEDDCLSMLGFLPNDAWEHFDGAYSSMPESEGDHLLMDFMSGAALKIQSTSVQCLIH
jgi:hypothetical protein